MRQTQKNAHQILNEQISASMQEYRRSDRALFISAFTAGLEIGFSVLLIGVLLTYFGANLDEGQLKLLIASGYPLGFIFVIVGRSELFTEHTALAIMPWLRGEVQLSELLKLWGLASLSLLQRLGMNPSLRTPHNSNVPKPLSFTMVVVVVIIYCCCYNKGGGRYLPASP